MPISDQQIADQQQGVEKRISLACQTHQRSVPTLLAVSKTRTPEDIRSLYSCSITNFGENYLQEALDKQQQLTDCDICWHFIGPIQSNKSRAVAENFQWVHSVDRLKLAKRLSNQRPSILPSLQICLQVNVDNESSKSGFLIDEAVNAALEISQLPNLRLRGLMCIPQKKETFTEQRQPFAETAALLHTINQQLPSATPALDTLSMGMSDDIEAAIAEGATIVRVGTALFGPRQYT